MLISCFPTIFTSSAQDISALRITELLASNDASLEDGFGGSPDWIEIHNSGAGAVSMSGLFLSDDRNALEMWAFPDVEVLAGGYLLVFASGKNSYDAETGEIHTNFRLSSQGEYIALTQGGGVVVQELPDGFPVQKPDVSYGVGSSANTIAETVVSAGAECRWLVPTAELDDDWRVPAFDDSLWRSGVTGVGYGYDGLVGEGGDSRAEMRGLNASVFIRVPFEIEDPALVTAMTLRMKYEDGFVAYLNGEEVARSNAPAGHLPFDAEATAVHPDEEAEVFVSFDLAVAGKLLSGTNVLAIHGLNLSAAGSNSSDFLALPELDLQRLEAQGEITFGYFNSPTPGAPNGAVDFSRFLDTPVFDVERGFYDDPFVATITSTEPGSDLVYTTDASTPSAENGTRIPAGSPEAIARAMVEVKTTTVLRAVSIMPGLPSYKAATTTYLFLEDVLEQPSQPEGYPATWFSAGAADYEMDADIVGEIYSRDELKAALRSLPTISLVTDVPNLFDRRTGIQINPQRVGEQWEKASSIELIDFEDADPVQFDCGWRMSGNASRNPSRPKHNLRIVFRPDYDKTPLEYPLFGTLDVQRFRTFILRGFNGDSWIHPSNSANGQYIRDQWFRDVHRAMGYEETLQREVHVYYNGLYWGVHHMFERTEDDFAVEHFGGEPEDWDAIRITAGGNVSTIDGTLDTWNATRQLARDRDYEGVQDFLNLDEFIDYLLVNFYGGNGDWDQNNVRALRSRAEGGRWHFFCHDSERAGLNAGGGSVNIDVTNKNTARGPTEMHQRLAGNDEYRLRFADRVHKHMFNDGVLTPARAEAFWRARAEGIREALKAESARWGDAKRSRPMTLVDWERLIEREYDSWFPRRTDIALGQLMRRDLYPDVPAPALSQHGGVVESGFPLVITNEEGEIVYSIDGSDPRMEGGSVNPQATRIAGATETIDVFSAGSDWLYVDTGVDLGSSAITVGAAGFGPDNWKHVEFDDSAWKTGPAPLGYGGIGSAELATVIEFGGDRGLRHITSYFRREFEIEDIAVVTSLSVDLMRDDGAVIYLNGLEVLRAGMPQGEVFFDTVANENVSGEPESTFVTAEISKEGLRSGKNVIAIEMHQVSPGSSDLGFDCALQLERLNDANGPVALIPPVTVKARSLNNGEWSALTEATFVAGLAPGPGEVALSELHYNPAAPTEEESAFPFVTDNDDFEFLELHNASGQPVDLSGAKFVRGIGYVFPEGSLLEVGAYVVVVRNRQAFQLRYPSVPATVVAGEFADGTGLANGGEWITLEDAAGKKVLNFRYDDRAPWPEQADGAGGSLVFSDQASNPNLASNWAVSAVAGGNPGSGGGAPVFPPDNVDSDGNGLSDFLDFVFGNSAGDTVHPRASFERDQAVVVAVKLQFRLRAALPPLSIGIETTGDLVAWSEIAEFERSDVPLGDDATMVTLRVSLTAEAGGTNPYYRIRLKSE